jgi:hypothetical protein
MVEQDDARGPVPPYGPAIWDAAKRGDLHEMEHIADAARLALAKGAKDAGVTFSESASAAAGHFEEVASHQVVEVREALSGLEKKIAELRGQQQKPAPGDPPAQ